MYFRGFVLLLEDKIGAWPRWMFLLLTLEENVGFQFEPDSDAYLGYRWRDFLSWYARVLGRE